MSIVTRWALIQCVHGAFDVIAVGLFETSKLTPANRLAVRIPLAGLLLSCECMLEGSLRGKMFESSSDFAAYDYTIKETF